MAALASGIVALIGLVLAFWTFSGSILTALGALKATAGFGLTIFASGIYVLAWLRDEVYFYGSGDILQGYPSDKIHPAVGPLIFTAAAIVGALVTLALAILWLRPSDAG